MLYYSSTVGATVKTQTLMIRNILGKENCPCSAELTVYSPGCRARGNLQRSTDITREIKNVLALIAVRLT